jgi:carotenoid cleavage dioxygenase
MTQPAPAPDPLLSGPFEPLGFECDRANLAIEGELPDGLSGVLYRIGPNPQFPPIAPYNPLQADGMIHAFSIRGGRVGCRNRWVRTRQWRLEREAGRALFATGDPRRSDASVAGVESEGAANTNLVAHGGRLLALEEGHRPIEVAPETLETIGPYDFAGRLPGAMTAHPKIDPATGEMFAFTNLPNRRLDGALAFHVVRPDGTLARSVALAGPYPAMVHDFAITARRVVFVVCPATLSLERLRAGRPPIAWEPELGAFVGVMARDGSGEDLRWRPAPLGMVWHTLNAFEDDGRIVLDLCRQDAAAFPAADGKPLPPDALRQRLERWVIDPALDGPVEARPLSDVTCEYPRLDERHVGRPYRYAFVAADGGPGTESPCHRALGRFDHETGAMTLWRAPAGQTVSEPVFAARPGASAEGSGWLLATVFDGARGASHLVVLDAMDVAAGPMARAHVGHRVPAGFHGLFVADP